MITTVKIPDSVRGLLRFLEAQGYQAYLVGGCVRDMLLGMAPHDWDICTDALPEALLRLFPDSLTYGLRHGTVTVRWEGILAEVTTFRAESAYTDHRRPDHVTFIQDLKADLARRDFTVNAIAMDASGNLRDPFGGQADLRDGVLRAVGNPEERFREDALRMLRAVRFSAQLNFRMEEKTLSALHKCAPLSAELAAERVCAETEKTLMTDHPEQVSVLSEAGLLSRWGISGPLAESDKLRRLPKNRAMRWIGLSLLLPELSPLQALRLDHETLALCEACGIIRGQTHRDELFWKSAISRYGAERSTICAEALAAWDRTEDLRTVRQILQRGDCCVISDLAIDGNDLISLGYQGREIGAALHAALRYIWAHPEQNNTRALFHFLREEREKHG